MFSSLNEAWGHDPVKEMTHKFSAHNGGNQTHADIYNFGGSAPVPAPAPAPTPTHTNHNLSRDSSPCPSFSLSSDQSSIDLLSDISTPPKTKKYPKHKNASMFTRERRDKFGSFDSSDSFNSSDSPNHPACIMSMRHIKKCNACYINFKKMVDRKVKEKFNDTVFYNSFGQNQPPNNTSVPMDTWKETLIIVAGAVIVILLIFLIMWRARWTHSLCRQLVTHNEFFTHKMHHHDCLTTAITDTRKQLIAG